MRSYLSGVSVTGSTNPPAIRRSGVNAFESQGLDPNRLHDPGIEVRFHGEHVRGLMVPVMSGEHRYKAECDTTFSDSPAVKCAEVKNQCVAEDVVSRLRVELPSAELGSDNVVVGAVILGHV